MAFCCPFQILDTLDVHLFPEGRDGFRADSLEMQEFDQAFGNPGFCFFELIKGPLFSNFADLPHNVFPDPFDPGECHIIHACNRRCKSLDTLGSPVEGPYFKDIIPFYLEDLAHEVQLRRNLLVCHLHLAGSRLLYFLSSSVDQFPLICISSLLSPGKK
ncbi:MAG: hypothetical protein BWY93_02069 [Euryarchaeota archaeon ADurb.BinA087]|nr:MAG: hypothetical protein BWY93_02069 [Euryarchaeota archaeon ADurb.BinA087]